MKIKLFWLLLIYAATTTGVFAQHRNEIGLQTDNDSYMLQGSDRYYTDGIYLYFRHALKPGSNTALANKVLGFEVGQKIFNPQAGNVPNEFYIDRPLAGYLYAGANLNLLYKNESNLKLSAQVGVIGPASKAEQVQRWVHNNFGFYEPTAWEYQIQNAAQLNLGAEYNRLLFRTTSFDISGSGYVNLGTGFNGAGIGPLFRLGNFNQLFNSVVTQSTAIAQANTAAFHQHEIFFYYKPQFNYVAYDATIQGGLGKKQDANSMEITRPIERAIFTNKLGVAFTTNRFVFDIAANFRSRETKGMIHASHSWGAITALYRFN